jgi:glyoxylase-like metal-dependent hydrolase (beta-lactamase superfamily II)
MSIPNISLDKRPEVSAFFDAQSNTISYVVKDPNSTSCAIIDAVMQFDYAAGRLSYESADEIIAFITTNGLSLEWII